LGEADGTTGERRMGTCDPRPQCGTRTDDRTVCGRPADRNLYFTLRNDGDEVRHAEVLFIKPKNGPAAETP